MRGSSGQIGRGRGGGLGGRGVGDRHNCLCCWRFVPELEYNGSKTNNLELKDNGNDIDLKTTNKQQQQQNKKHPKPTSYTFLVL